ncbi:MAG: GCN5-related N-acetyltransferase [Nocardioides sp.]|nr:GCN5-related N-acetyltransferase [Nocardioides sp.]
MPGTAGVVVSVTPWDDADAARLRAAQRVELDERYGTDDHEPGTPPSAADIDVFVLAHVDGIAVGCGGLRLLEVGAAEIKRMYVEPFSRGSGVATAVLRKLESLARDRSISRLLLETGPAQPDAIRFYEREGYTSIPNFGPYVGGELSVCFARDL